MLSRQFWFFAALIFPSLTAGSACLANNCERAFNGATHTEGAKEFCSNFTTAITLTTDGFPTYATPACSLVAEISSICSCAYPSATVAPPHCLQDNCLRAFENNKGQQFCSMFTYGDHIALPTYATMCTGSTSARVSSACTCLNYKSPSAKPKTTSQTFTSISITSLSSVTTSSASSSSVSSISNAVLSTSSSLSSTISSAVASSLFTSPTSSSLTPSFSPGQPQQNNVLFAYITAAVTGSQPAAISSPALVGPDSQPGGVFIPYSASATTPPAAITSAEPRLQIEVILG